MYIIDLFKYYNKKLLLDKMLKKKTHILLLPQMSEDFY